jgi:hypothetical protein
MGGEEEHVLSFYCRTSARIIRQDVSVKWRRAGTGEGRISFPCFPEEAFSLSAPPTIHTPFCKKGRHMTGCALAFEIKDRDPAFCCSYHKWSLIGMDLEIGHPG